MSTAPEATFEPHRAQVYAWAYRLLQNHHDALDVVQEVLVKWWQARRKGDAPTNPVGWLRRVTINLAIDAVRSAARKPEVHLGGALPTSRETVSVVQSTDEPVRRETALRIAAALDALSDRQRVVVVAKVYDGCTFAQIAEQTGTSVPTAKTHYLRALQALRRRLPEDRPSGTPAADRTQPGEPSNPLGDCHEL